MSKEVIYLGDQKKVMVCFDKDNYLTLKTDDPKNLVEKLTTSKTDWVFHDDVVINVKNINYVRVRDIEPWF